MNNIITINTKMTLWLTLVLFLMAGCSAVHTAVKKRNLDVQTQMSETVFLDPVAADKRTVFIQLRNTSDKQELDIEASLTAAIRAKGYTILTDPDKAHYWIQANILKVGKSDLREAKSILSQGYGGAVAGAVVGSQIGGGSGVVAGSIFGSLGGIVTDALVDDVLFLMITDLQISEKAKGDVVVTEANNAQLKQGTSGYKTVSSTEQTDRKKHQTRVVSTANKVNLKFIEAQPKLIIGLSNSLSGLL
jgi:outer membrane lipoprotein SlyB